MHIANTGTEVIIAGLSGAILAQLIKTVSYIICFRKVNFRMLTQAGGMPSSHSSSMCAMATSVGLVDGFSSVSFSIALGIALIVMYDAAGVRHAAGKMAGVLNRITEDFYRHHPEHLPVRLKELLGHTPFEVFVGALFGICLSLIYHDTFLRLYR